MIARKDRQHAPKLTLVKKLGIALIIIGICVGMVPIFTIAYGRYQQKKLLERTEARIKAEREKASHQKDRDTKLMKTTPVGHAGPWPATKIIIPKLGIEQVVQEGIDADTLTQSPGHYPKTVNPGQVGWCAIAGHRITFSAPFDRLNEMARGDRIILETAEARFVYLFNTIVTVPDTANLDMLDTDEARIILTTCEPKTGSSHRLIARGTLAPYPTSRYLIPPKTKH